MLNQQEQEQLIDVAKQSIKYGLEHGERLEVDSNDYPASLTPRRATFVTLKKNSQLRGCIGTLTAHAPLVIDVADNAFSAAFKDPRFPPVTEKEFNDLQYHISILSEPEPMQIKNEQDLLDQLRPGIDGVVLHEVSRRSTFLPSVWESLSDPKSFIENLKLKAGLDKDYWSDTIHFERYTVEEF
ncbi:MAG: AmmeMemoRadiSam system protein A [Thioalkalispiraceae bacterium]|jgi:AmmeMemoRadiSam system protein A